MPKALLILPRRYEYADKLKASQAIISLLIEYSVDTIVLDAYHTSGKSYIEDWKYFNYIGIVPTTDREFLAKYGNPEYLLNIEKYKRMSNVELRPAIEFYHTIKNWLHLDTRISINKAILKTYKEGDVIVVLWFGHLRDPNRFSVDYLYQSRIDFYLFTQNQFLKIKRSA